MCLGQGSFWSPWECLGTRSICDKGLERGGRAWLGHTWTVRAVLPQVADGEVKASTLQLTVERLSGALAKVEESEGLLRDKVQSLTEALTQSSASLASTQDKNVQLQKALTACEHDRQVLQVWRPQGPAVGGTVESWPLGAVCGCTLWEILAQYADWPMRGGWGCHNGQDGVQGPGADPREQGWGLGAPRLMGACGQACTLAYHADEGTAHATGCEPGLEAPGSAEPFAQGPHAAWHRPFSLRSGWRPRGRRHPRRGNRAAPWASSCRPCGASWPTWSCGGRRLRGSGSSCRR